MPSMGYGPSVIKDWLVGGVDFNLAGNGGPACSGFTPPLRRYTEFIFGISIAAIIITWAYKFQNSPTNIYCLNAGRNCQRLNCNLSWSELRTCSWSALPLIAMQLTGIVGYSSAMSNFWITFTLAMAINSGVPECRTTTRRDRGGRKTLLAIVSLVFGMEVAYKFSTKTVIFLLNPCHVITAIQIYLLAASPSRFVTALFRVHLNFLNGAILALVFPVTNTLFLPFETEIYFIQHFMMLVTPYYLLRVGGVYNVEKLSDFTWTYLSYAIMILYHFVILLPIALPLEVNISQMLCPAISDPFYGPDYRLWTIVHQAIFVPALCKAYCATCTYFITKFPLTKVKSNIDVDLALLTTVPESKNGYSKQCHHCHSNGNM